MKRLDDKADFAIDWLRRRAAAVLSREARMPSGIDRRIVVVEFALRRLATPWTSGPSSPALAPPMAARKDVYLDDKYQDFLRQGIGIVGITHSRTARSRNWNAITMLKDAGMQC